MSTIRVQWTTQGRLTLWLTYFAEFNHDYSTVENDYRMVGGSLDIEQVVTHSTKSKLSGTMRVHVAHAPSIWGCMFAGSVEMMRQGCI
jgi:hypothetical protein